jgi:hypothetical protein
MRLNKSSLHEIAHKMVALLQKDGDIECDEPKEVARDLEAVLTQYVDDEQAITSKARDLLAARGLPSSELGKTRRALAEQRGLKLDDEAIDYLLDQLLEMLMHSGNVAEVFAEDYQLRRKLREPLRREAAEEEKLQEQVRGQLKHVQEGTSLWEVEYRRVMEDIKRRRGS